MLFNRIVDNLGYCGLLFEGKLNFAIYKSDTPNSRRQNLFNMYEKMA
jgi:hypothetical protein